MTPVLLIYVVSFLVRLAAWVWSLWLLRQIRDWRVGAVSLAITATLIEAASQGLGPQPAGGSTSLWTELPVGLLALAAVAAIQHVHKNTAATTRRTEQEHEELIAELETKNAELERFSYTVSHDLKTPLVTIRGFLGLLERDANAGDVERMGRDISRIRAATEIMGQLLDELLELSRIGRQVNPPEAVPLGDLAREAVDLIAPALSQRDVEIRIAPELPVVQGDRSRLLEVFQNLLENAVKYMGQQPEPYVEVSMRNGDRTVFYVRDNGIGIDPRYHEKVFGLFERLSSDQAGTGVGLALVKRIIEQHGGRIWVESEGNNRGSTFFFTLSTQIQKPTAGLKESSQPVREQVWESVR